MGRRGFRAVLGIVIAVAVTTTAGCSTTGSRDLKCTSAEIAPNSQPGSKTAKAAFEWYLANRTPHADPADYELTSNSKTRYVYSDGRHQISVGALPSDEDQPRVWVVMMTFDCG